jgi:hypothetical protein
VVRAGATKARHVTKRHHLSLIGWSCASALLACSEPGSSTHTNDAAVLGTRATPPSSGAGSTTPDGGTRDGVGREAGAVVQTGGASGPVASTGGSGALDASVAAATDASPSEASTPPVDAATVTTLFYLDTGGKVLRALADGTQRNVIAQGKGVGPDGIAVDLSAGHVFWTNMGVPSADDGTILRSNLDGSAVTTIVPSGGTFTPKQLKIDGKNGKLYWSDREGMRVMRANLDGSQIEPLVTTGSTATDRQDASKWCVGIALDVAGGRLYWTQKGGDNAHQGTIKRAHLDPLPGEDSAHRSDIEVLFKNLPEPIDLDLDLEHRLLYWTDRGDETISRAPLDPPTGIDPAARTDRQILLRGLGEAIGIALDVSRNRMFYTSLAGIVAAAELDGNAPHDVLTAQGALTGIALVDLPK